MITAALHKTPGDRAASETRAVRFLVGKRAAPAARPRWSSSAILMQGVQLEYWEALLSARRTKGTARHG
jgi:hypothetical protein